MLGWMQRRWAGVARLARGVTLRPRLAAAIAAGILFALVLRTAWVAEDAFITFRSLEQLFAGNGPRWNPNERVQSFTHPLWFGALALGRLATGDAYWAAIALNLLCTAAALGVLFAARPRRALALAALLASSQAWIDYATSGLENALSYLLLAGLLVTARREAASGGPARLRPTLLALGLVSLLALNRLDTLALTLPTAAWLSMRLARGRGVGAALAAASLAAIPLAAWTAFSVFYYGFPLPNTAYAKLNTGIPLAQLAEQGAFYLWNSLRWDPITLAAMAGACALAVAGREPLCRAVAAGLVLTLLYVLRVGGDFMSGRFLAVAFLAAAAVFAESAGPLAWRAAVVALLAAPLVGAAHPLRFASHEKRMDEHRIADERSFYARQTSIATCWRRARAGLPCPDHEWAREGRELRASGRRIDVRKAIGMFGYAAGTEPIIIDSLALADPLLARLPVDGSWRIGHFWRRVPDGYPATLLTGRNQIGDPRLREWYAHLATITQGPLCSRERWVTIAKMNLGAYQPLLEAYTQSTR
jgi:arabinofuranosyltransferase